MVESADTRDLKSLAGNGVRVQVPPAAPRRRGLRIVRDGVFFFKANAISHSLRRSSFPQKVTLASPVRLQARSQRLWLATNLLRVRLRCMGAFSSPIIPLGPDLRSADLRSAIRDELPAFFVVWLDREQTDKSPLCSHTCCRRTCCRRTCGRQFVTSCRLFLLCGSTGSGRQLNAVYFFRFSSGG